jgi:hypothetical protein
MVYVVHMFAPHNTNTHPTTNTRDPINGAPMFGLLLTSFQSDHRGGGQWSR